MIKIDKNPYNLEKIKLIQKSDRCRECIGKLFNKNNYIYLGKGKYTSNTMFVIPPYNIDKISPVERELSQLYKELFDRDIYEHSYITQSIKCPIKDVDKIQQAYYKCNYFLYDEIYIINPSVVFVIGKQYEYIANQFKSIFTNILFINTPNPLTKTLNPQQYKELQSQLKKYVLL